MLTRAGVARRLGKSIATVRRMEGVVLHPIVDARGVHRFDVCDVDALAHPLTRRTQLHVGGHASRPYQQRLGDGDFDQPAMSDGLVSSGAAHAAEARAWAEQARVDALTIRDERRRLERARREELVALVRTRRELGAVKEMLILELESSDERVLRRLTAADRAEIIALLEAE